VKLSSAAREARGEPETEKPEAEMIEYFKVIDTLTPDAAGISMTNLMATHR
jgi:hypothetical protein